MTVVKKLPAPGTNQIAGFSGYRPLTIKEINKTMKTLKEFYVSFFEIDGPWWDFTAVTKLIKRFKSKQVLNNRKLHLGDMDGMECAIEWFSQKELY